jgi:hypothetical protein
MKRSLLQSSSFGFSFVKMNLVVAIIATGALVFISCEKDQNGLLNPSIKTPLVNSAVLVHGHVDLDTTTGASVTRMPDGTYIIRDTIWAWCDSGENRPSNVDRMATLRYRVLSATGSEVLSSGTIVPDCGTPCDGLPSTFFSHNLSFPVTRADAGRLQVEVTATYPGGLSGNTLLVPFLVTRRNSLPVMSDLIAPDSIVRPSTGFDLLLFTAAVHDSDGYNDIQEVSFRRTSPTPSSSITMFDDGKVKDSGDEVSGDGIFSRIVRIDSTALLGAQVFEFVAKDRSGATSLPLLDTIRIVQ